MANNFDIDFNVSELYSSGPELMFMGEQVETITNDELFDSSSSPSYYSESDGFSPLRDDCMSPLEDLSQLSPPAPLQSSASGIWTGVSLSNEEMEIPDNIFGNVAPSIDIEEPRETSTAGSFTSTSVGVKTPSNVFGGIFVNDVNSISASSVSSSASSPMTWHIAVLQPQPIFTTASVVVPTPAQKPVSFSSSRTPSPVSSSEDEDVICDLEESEEDRDDEDCCPNGATECIKCAKMFESFLRDPKNKLGKLSPADELLTDEMYKKYTEKSVNMDADEKASHIDLYFKLRDIKALRKMVGLHNKSHFTKSKPNHVESTTRLLGQKYKLTRNCVEDPSIPFRKFLKAKKAAGRSKPSRSARQATTQIQPKKASSRYTPY